jgi:ATP-dependent DNA ligase
VAFQRKKSAATGIKAPYPGFIEPALATTVAEVPSGKRWVHEIKMDGYRVQVHLRDAVVKVYTRRGHNWTNRFRKISSDAWHVNAGSAIIDAEVVVPGADGITDLKPFGLSADFCRRFFKKAANNFGLSPAFFDASTIASGPNLTLRFAWGFPEGLACASLGDARANKHPIEPSRP